MKTITISTKKEFEVYAMLYVASLDQRISEEEVENIMSGISQETFNKVLSLFKKSNDMEIIETLQNCKKQFLETEEDIEQFIQRLTILAQADEKHSPIEIANINMLKQMLI